MKKELSFIKPQIRALKPYSLKLHEYDIKLNQNENPFPFPAALKEEVFRRLQERNWAHYPDFYLREIRGRLAEYAGVPDNWVLVGNGSNELLQLILLSIVEPGDTILIPVPTFTLYRLQATIIGAEVVEPMLAADFSLPVETIVAEIRARRPKAIVLVSPNNPTGNIHPLEHVRPIIEAQADGLVLLDEAYVEFTDQDYQGLLREYENVVLLRTFSKAWALAGARVGYMLAHPALIEQLGKAKLPYGLNIFSETAAVVALEHRELLFEAVQEIVRQREKLYQALQALPGVHPYPSAANFILCRFDRPTEEVFQACLEAGILIRDVSYYPGLAGHLRITVGSAAENQALVQALQDFLIP